MLFVGIDPGKSGAIAIIGPMLRFSACRLSEEDETVYEWLRDEIGGETSRGCLELVHSMPGDAKPAAFKFGTSYGKCQMLLAACGIPYDMITPQKWMKSMECMTRGDKKISRDKARLLFPSLDVFMWNADSLLIAEYCRRQWEKQHVKHD